jgi:hypothetical protein
MYFSICRQTQRTDYVAEKGATRNFQAIKRAEDEEERLKREREEEGLNNPMKVNIFVLFSFHFIQGSKFIHLPHLCFYVFDSQSHTQSNASGYKVV